jgi:hypothetical protein
LYLSPCGLVILRGGRDRHVWHVETIRPQQAHQLRADILGERTLESVGFGADKPEEGDTEAGRAVARRSSMSIAIDESGRSRFVEEKT